MRSIDVVRQSLRASADILAETNATEATLMACARFADAALLTLQAGGRLFACGNGGSLSDAMHFAEEWTGRFRNDRRALSALAFSDPVALSCIANDFGWEEVFARQVQAHGRSGDLLLAISTSGDSENVVRAIQAACELDMTTVALLGKNGGKAGAHVDIPIIVPRAVTADRIQEVHIQLIHATIEAVERELFPENYLVEPVDTD